MGRWLNRIVGPEDTADDEDHIRLEDLARLAEGRVDPAEGEHFARHLNRCAACYEILKETLGDLSLEKRASEGSRWPLFALAASIVLCLLIGGGIFLKYHGGPKGVVVASLVMDKNLKQVLMEDQALSWEKGERVDRLSTLLRGRGVLVKDLNRVELSAPYIPSKDSSRDLFAPKEILKVRIEKGVAYLRVVEEK